MNNTSIEFIGSDVLVTSIAEKVPTSGNTGKIYTTPYLFADIEREEDHGQVVSRQDVLQLKRFPGGHSFRSE